VVPLPKEWSATRRRQFEHVRESLVARGRTWEKATEIAARTVNKQRREAGETIGRSRSSEGHGREPPGRGSAPW
jgi:hypothetical protein